MKDKLEVDMINLLESGFQGDNSDNRDIVLWHGDGDGEEIKAHRNILSLRYLRAKGSLSSPKVSHDIQHEP